MARKKSIIPGFSLNRALGITSAKQKIAHATGIPTTKQGRKRKMQSHLWTAAAVGVASVLSQPAQKIQEKTNQAKQAQRAEANQNVKQGLSKDEYTRAVSTPRKVRKIVLIILAALVAACVLFFKIRDILWSIAW